MHTNKARQKSQVEQTKHMLFSLFFRHAEKPKQVSHHMLNTRWPISLDSSRTSWLEVFRGAASVGLRVLVHGYISRVRALYGIRTKQHNNARDGI